MTDSEWLKIFLVVDDSVGYEIAEIDGVKPSVSLGSSGASFSTGNGTKRKLDRDEIPTEKKPKLDGHGNESYNFPVLKGTFLDPETNLEMLVVHVLLYPDVKIFKYEVNETEEGNQNLVFNYGWPDLFQDAVTLCQQEGKPAIPNFHPMVLAVQEDLKNYRAHEDEKPFGKIIVPLPRKINLDDTTWRNWLKKKPNGTVVSVFQFVCVQNEYKKVNKTVVIE